MEKHLREEERPSVDDPFDDAFENPFGDDLGEQLAKMAPRRYVTRSTLILAAVVLLLAGFVAGAQVQKRYGTTGSATATSTGRAGGGNFTGGNFGGGGQNAGGQQPQPSNAANLNTGTVKLVDGNTVYLQLANGDIITVRTTGSTTVALTQPGSIKDLTPGAQVTVEGPAAGEGTVNATKVTRGK